MKIVFVCTTCEYRNRQYAGEKDFNLHQTEYDNLTDAVYHIMDSRNYDYHIMEVKIEKE